MTIHEMRKKLESKRSVPRDDSKLAIEAKSLADFKVPEIPLKRIQEIYKNSDLLRSRSESDLITNSYSLVNKNNYSSEYQSTNSLESKQDHSPEKIILKKSNESKQTAEPENSSNDKKISSFISSSKSSSVAEEIPNGEALSSKINSLQLNNKNISEDINTIENDLKTLSEIMSRFSKKSDDKIPNNSASENEKSTSKDVSEDLPKSDNGETINSIPEISEVPGLSEVPEVSEVISSNAKLPEEIDFEARSKEILNVIEKSIISEHIKLSGNNLDLTGAALEKSMQNLHKENEALSSDFNSLEGDIKSISEIISKMAESKRSLSIATDISQSILAPDSSINPDDNPSTIYEEVSENIDENSREQIEEISEPFEDSDLNADNTDEKVIESTYSNLAFENEDDKISEKNSEGISVGQISEQNDWTISDSFEATHEKMFIPTGESTNIHDFGLEELNFQKGVTDELDDILDIIARESEETSEIFKVPEALNLEIGNKTIVPANNELNLTAEVEPVLQKLTKILQSVERNIAKRTQNKEEQHELVGEIKVSEDFENESITQTDFSVPQLVLPVEEKSTRPSFSQKDVFKDPEYEDISEESLEVSEILDRSESVRSNSSRKSKKIPEKYEAVPKTDDVLRILDQISQQSLLKVGTNSSDHLQDLEITIQVFGSLSPGDLNKHDEEVGVVIEELTSENAEKIVDEDLGKNIDDMSEEKSEKSADADTPRGVSEIDMDSPRDANDSRLDIEMLDDDLLAGSGIEITEEDAKLEFPADGVVGTTEKDIEIMIEKLRGTCINCFFPILLVLIIPYSMFI